MHSCFVFYNLYTKSQWIFLLLLFMSKGFNEEINAYRLGTTWGWINYFSFNKFLLKILKSSCIFLFFFCQPFYTWVLFKNLNPHDYSSYYIFFFKPSMFRWFKEPMMLQLSCFNLYFCPLLWFEEYINIKLFKEPNSNSTL